MRARLNALFRGLAIWIPVCVNSFILTSIHSLHNCILRNRSIRCIRILRIHIHIRNFHHNCILHIHNRNCKFLSFLYLPLLHLVSFYIILLFYYLINLNIFSLCGISLDTIFANITFLLKSTSLFSISNDPSHFSFKT